MVELLSSRTQIVWVCALLAANVALELRPAKPELLVAAVDGTGNHADPVPVRPAFAIKPPVLRDAEPWPRGMVMVPPETGDRMAIYVPSVAIYAAGDDLLSALLAPLVDLVRPARPSLL